MPNDIDIAWLAGLLEGEGNFHIIEHKSRKPTGQQRQVCVRLGMNDRDVVERASSIFAAGKLGIRPATDMRKPHYYIGWYAHKARELMTMIRPYMGLRRGAKIDACLAVLDELYGQADE